MNSDSEIASRLKTIYIENENQDPEFLSDHFAISWNQLYDIIFTEHRKESGKL